MILTYRGSSYKRASTTLEMTETSEEGVFRGVRFKLKQSQSTHRHQLSTQQLTYRGVCHTR